MNLSARIAALREAEKNRTPGEWQAFSSKRWPARWSKVIQKDVEISKIFGEFGSGNHLNDATYMSECTHHLGPLLDAVDSMREALEWIASYGPGSGSPAMGLGVVAHKKCSISWEQDGARNEGH